MEVFLWTSQGLNLGPPDYESERLMFYDFLYLYISLIHNDLLILQ